MGIPTYIKYFKVVELFHINFIANYMWYNNIDFFLNIFPTQSKGLNYTYYFMGFNGNIVSTKSVKNHVLKIDYLELSIQLSSPYTEYSNI